MNLKKKKKKKKEKKQKKPLSLSKGREALVGSSLKLEERAFIRLNPEIARGRTAASVPPAIIISRKKNKKWNKNKIKIKKKK